MTALSTLLPNKALRFVLGGLPLSVGVVLGALFLIAPMDAAALFPISNLVAPPPSDVNIVHDRDGYVKAWEAYYDAYAIYAAIEAGIILVVAGGLFLAGYTILPIRGKGLILSVVFLPVSAVVAVQSALDGNGMWAGLCVGSALWCAWDIWTSFRDSTNDTIGTVRFASVVVLRIVGSVTLMVISGLFWGVAFSGFGELDNLLGLLFLSVLIGVWGGWAVRRLRRHPVSIEDEELWRRAVAWAIRVSPYIAVGAWCLGLGVGL